jgi:hypothetical protein
MIKSADISNDAWAYFDIYLVQDKFKSWVYDKTADLYCPYYEECLLCETQSSLMYQFHNKIKKKDTIHISEVKVTSGYFCMRH